MTESTSVREYLRNKCGTASSGSQPELPLTRVSAGQQRGACFAGRTVVREDSASSLRSSRVGWIVVSFVVVTPFGLLVPVSPQVSMAAEDFHGNRGLVP